jgi:hypothetical protein
VGDGFAGDGLTLFEEYRGFLQTGKWFPGDPKVKDFFIQDRIGARAKAGYRLFGAITGLTVHHDLRSWEFTRDRVVNANWRGGPHRVDQHAIIVNRHFGRPESRASGDAGTPGTPGMFRGVYIGTGFQPDAPMQELTRNGVVLRRSNWYSTIAHELGHCCNVWHHGEVDERDEWFRDGAVPAAMYEGNANPISVLLESGARVRPEDLVAQGKVYKAYRGVWWGQHSGVEDCVMRYDCARCYAPRAQGIRYLIEGDELTGATLCESSLGTGVNDRGRNTPEPRYGPAAKGRGDCRHQLRVNDAGVPPAR